jgi:cysteine desulfurase / selenocysteine lyase
MFDPEKIKKQFPIFERKIKDKPLVYLDSAATTQKPYVVIETLTDFYKNHNANVHRGAYTLSDEATYKYEQSRAKVAKFINAEMLENIIFTRNSTESINLVAGSWGRANLKSGDEILLTMMEHHSNLVPWQIIAGQTGAKLKFISLTPDGKLDLSNINELLNPRTKIMSVVHVSNSLGTINPVKELIRLAHQNKTPVLIDATQSVPHMSVDVKELDCDFLAFSGHKMLGPTGIGILYGKVDLLDAMPPYMAGGEMISEVQLEWSEYRNLPWKFEAGTPHIAGAIGLGSAIDYLNSVGMENIQLHEQTLLKYALDKLKVIEGLQIYGPSNERGGSVAFNIQGVHPHDVSTILDAEGIAIRAGHHCTQPIMRWLDVAATVRASFYVYNLKSDIDKLVEGLQKVKEVFVLVGK